MTRQERMTIVAEVCRDLWAVCGEISTEDITDHVLDQPDWGADGYDGMQPWSRARRYVQQYIATLKGAGAVQVITNGTDHYNSGGTIVRYRRVNVN